MTKLLKSTVLILLLLIFCPVFVLAEDITITTYYPSPYGSYKNLSIYNQDESTTQADFTGALTKAGIIITTDYTDTAFTPGIFWSTTNNSPTIPKAGIYLKETGTGTNMYFGTSNNYAVGITNDAMVINPSGNVGIGTVTPGAKLDVMNGDIRVGGQAVSSNFKYITGLADWRNNAASCAATTWCAVPGRSLVFTKTRAGSLIRVTYQDTLGTYGTDYGQCIWRILIDGVQYQYFSAADGPARALAWTMENAAHHAIASGLTAAAHTVTVQNYRAAAATECLSGWNTGAQSWLGIEEVGP